MTRKQIQLKIDKIYKGLYDYSFIIKRKLRVKQSRMIRKRLKRIKKLEKRRDKIKKVTMVHWISMRMSDLIKKSKRNV